MNRVRKGVSLSRTRGRLLEMGHGIFFKPRSTRFILINVRTKVHKACTMSLDLVVILNINEPHVMRSNQNMKVKVSLMTPTLTSSMQNEYEPQ